MAAALSILSLLPLRHGGSVRLWLLTPAIVFGLLALAAPKALRPLNRLWTQLGVFLARIVNPVITALLFAAVFVPVGLILQLRRRDPLQLRKDPGAPTYWKLRAETAITPESFFRQF
jgi:hypothetical protein